ncbi:hypothetical protein LAX5112_04655 [Roseibium alexandrii]|uniref:Uncharacterized protein n=1 Tax=Roseibium alexandrii TaxID=388408 RepID=A0A0M7AQ27_9HYPH|nr:hypothetical protein LAX5112_04655 [Roseibium alexandrii]
MQCGGFGEGCHALGRGEGPGQQARRDRVDLRPAWKQPAVGPCLTPVIAQHVQKIGRQHGLVILAALALIDMDQLRDFLHAQHNGQWPRLALKLHMPLHVLAPAGHAAKEPKGNDPDIECRRRHPRIRHVQLIAAQLFRSRRIGWTAKVRCKILDGPDMALLSLLAYATNVHVFDHSLAQWRGSLLRHENLLSDD